MLFLYFLVRLHLVHVVQFWSPNYKDMNDWRDFSNMPRRLGHRKGQRSMENDSRNSATLYIRKKGRPREDLILDSKDLNKFIIISHSIFLISRLKTNPRTEKATQHEYQQEGYFSRFESCAIETTFLQINLVQKY